MQKKIAGILGGMGPEATVDFIAKVLEQTKAHADQDHIRMLVDHNPKVPNRHAAINGEGEDVGQYLAGMARGLERAGADFLVMVCNTAHAFQADIQAAVAIPFVSIVDEVIVELKNQYPNDTRVGIMAAQGCLQSQLYQRALSEAGFQFVVWSEKELAQFMAILYRIKAGDTGDEVRQRTASLADVLVHNGAQVLLSGCTEIPLVLNSSSLSVPLVESTNVLVTGVIDYSLGNKIIPGIMVTQ